MDNPPSSGKTAGYCFPATFSHHQNQQAPVSELLHDGIELALRNWITGAAASEFSSLQSLLQAFALSGEPDTRTFTSGEDFSTKGEYVALSLQLSDPKLDSIWSSRVPAKVKIFGWLLHLDPLSARVNLHRETLPLKPVAPLHVTRRRLTTLICTMHCRC